MLDWLPSGVRWSVLVAYGAAGLFLISFTHEVYWVGNAPPAGETLWFITLVVVGLYSSLRGMILGGWRVFFINLPPFLLFLFLFWNGICLRLLEDAHRARLL